MARLHSPLDGDDLMALFDKARGRGFGRSRSYLLDLVLEGQLDQDDRATATELARRFAAEREIV